VPPALADQQGNVRERYFPERKRPTAISSAAQRTPGLSAALSGFNSHPETGEISKVRLVKSQFSELVQSILGSSALASRSGRTAHTESAVAYRTGQLGFNRAVGKFHHRHGRYSGMYHDPHFFEGHAKKPVGFNYFPAPCSSGWQNQWVTFRPISHEGCSAACSGVTFQAAPANSCGKVSGGGKDDCDSD